MDSVGSAWRLLIKLGNAFARVVQIAVLFAWGFLAGFCGLALFGDGGFGWILLLWAVLHYPAVAVHELGHCVGARLGGMRVSAVQIGALEFIPLRRGFRWRWMPLPKKARLGGYVMAYPHPRRPPRQSRVLMIGGGPAANLIVAVCFSGVGELARPHAFGWLCLMFAAINAALGLGNLVPHMGTLANDGLRLWQLWRAGPDYVEDVSARLAGASMAGCTADSLPEHDLAELEARGTIGKLSALWYRLKGAQNRGEWAQAAAAQDVMEALLSELDPRSLAPWKEFLTVLRAEIAFSRAVLSHDSAAIGNELLPPKLAWYMPHFRPRCLALQAALAGDAQRCMQWLDKCRGYAERSNDAALPLSEAMIAVEVRALLMRTNTAATVTPELA